MKALIINQNIGLNELTEKELIATNGGWLTGPILTINGKSIGHWVGYYAMKELHHLMNWEHITS